MDLKIQTIHFTADEKLKLFIEKKINKLTTFHDKIISANVILKLENVVHHIKDKDVEIKIDIPKHHFFTKHSSKSFEESFEYALDAMIAQIKKHKEKTQG